MSAIHTPSISRDAITHRLGLIHNGLLRTHQFFFCGPGRCSSYRILSLLRQRTKGGRRFSGPHPFSIQHFFHRGRFELLPDTGEPVKSILLSYIPHCKPLRSGRPHPLFSSRGCGQVRKERRVRTPRVRRFKSGRSHSLNYHRGGPHSNESHPERHGRSLFSRFTHRGREVNHIDNSIDIDTSMYIDTIGHEMAET